MAREHKQDSHMEGIPQRPVLYAFDGEDFHVGHAAEELAADAVVLLGGESVVGQQLLHQQLLPRHGAPVGGDVVLLVLLGLHLLRNARTHNDNNNNRGSLYSAFCHSKCFTT